MTAVREHAWQDMTCTVEAGCTWSRCRPNSRATGRWSRSIRCGRSAPPSAASSPPMTAARCGRKYGGLRDLIIGMTVVLADGTIAKSGGKVVKNVAGYDLHKLMTGSFGTLGVIAEVNFRLHPVEEHAAHLDRRRAERAPRVFADAAARTARFAHGSFSASRFARRKQECCARCPHRRAARMPRRIWRTARADSSATSPIAESRRGRLAVRAQQLFDNDAATGPESLRASRRNLRGHARAAAVGRIGRRDEICSRGAGHRLDDGRARRSAHEAAPALDRAPSRARARLRRQRCRTSDPG